MASELLWKEPGQIEVAVGSYVRCRDSKRGRNRPANLCPSWRGLLESVGVERLQQPPQRLRNAASPWDDKPTQISNGEQNTNLEPFTAGSGESCLMRKASRQTEKLLDCANCDITLHDASSR